MIHEQVIRPRSSWTSAIYGYQDRAKPPDPRIRGHLDSRRSRHRAPAAGMRDGQYIYICSRTVATDHDIDSARGTPGESSSAAIADGGYGVDGAGRRVES